MRNINRIVVSGVLATLSACGNNSSDSGAGSGGPGASVANGQETPQNQDSGSAVSMDRCEITGISVRPGSGTLSKKTSSLRAVIDFTVTPGINVDIYSAVFSVDGNDRILSDVTEFTSDTQVTGGEGQVLLSYNLNTAPPEYDWQFSYADPDEYNKVSVSIYQSILPSQSEGYVCTATKEVNLILTP